MFFFCSTTEAPPVLNHLKRFRFDFSTPTHRLRYFRLSRLLGGSGLLGLVATELGLGGLLDGALGALDGRDTLNGVLAQVSAVSGLGGLVGNGLVGPVL